MIEIRTVIAYGGYLERNMKKLSGDGNVLYAENRVDYMGIYIHPTLFIGTPNICAFQCMFSSIKRNEKGERQKW